MCKTHATLYQQLNVIIFWTVKSTDWDTLTCPFNFIIPFVQTEKWREPIYMYCFYQRSQQKPKHCMLQWLLAHLIFQKGETALPGTAESFHKILCSGKLISGAASLKKFSSESLIIHGESLYYILTL